MDDIRRHRIERCIENLYALYDLLAKPIAIQFELDLLKNIEKEEHYKK